MLQASATSSFVSPLATSASTRADGATTVVAPFALARSLTALERLGR